MSIASNDPRAAQARKGIGRTDKLSLAKEEPPRGADARCEIVVEAVRHRERQNRQIVEKMPGLHDTTEKAARGGTAISEEVRRHDADAREIDGVDITESHCV